MANKNILFSDELTKQIQDYANKHLNGNFTKAVNELAESNIKGKNKQMIIKGAEWVDFFNLAEKGNIKPFAVQINKDGDFYGWSLCLDIDERVLIADKRKFLVWETIDTLINDVFENGDLYYSIKTYYCGGDLPFDIEGNEIEYKEHKKLERK